MRSCACRPSTLGSRVCTAVAENAATAHSRQCCVSVQIQLAVLCQCANLRARPLQDLQEPSLGGLPVAS